MRPRVRDIRYCYDCKESTSHVRGAEFADWTCDSHQCKERRARKQNPDNAAVVRDRGDTDGKA